MFQKTEPVLQTQDHRPGHLIDGAVLGRTQPGDVLDCKRIGRQHTLPDTSTAALAGRLGTMSGLPPGTQLPSHRFRRVGIYLRCPTTILAIFLAAFAVPSSSVADAVTGTGATRGPDSNRFSFGFLAGTSLALHQTRMWSQPSFAMFNIGVRDTYTQRNRHGAVAPLVGAFAAMRLWRGFSVQASLSLRVLPFTQITQEMQDVPPFRRFIWRMEDQWAYLELPTLVTYRFEGARNRPFVGFGPAFRITKARWHEPKYGAAATFGFDLFRSRRVSLTPQIRYAHWFGGVERPTSAPSGRIQVLVAAVF